MNKPRKYNGVYKLPIKKHTKVRRPMSRWQLEYMLFENNPVLISNTLKMSIPPIKVQDISKGLENPLDLKWPLKKMPYMMKQEFLTPKEFEEMTKQQKGDWPKDMEAQEVINQVFTDKIFDDNSTKKTGHYTPENKPGVMNIFTIPKPSIWQRFKRKGRR